MEKLRISLDKLPRILKRELDIGADALNGFEENEIPKPPKLKYKKPDITTAEVFALKELENNSIDSFQKSSALAFPLYGPVELDAPDPLNHFEDYGKYTKFLKPKLLKFLWIIREGLSVSDAAELVGWDPDDVQSWINSNKGNLGKCVKTAKLEHKAFHISRTNAASYGYQASTWMLERKYKDEFSKELKIVSKTENENSQVIKFGDREIHF